MKGNSDLVINGIEGPALWEEEDLQSPKIFEKFMKNTLSVKPEKRIKNYNFLIHFWAKLIFNPLSYTHDPSTEINNILEEEVGLLAYDATNTVLAEKLNLPMNSKGLLKANEDSTKIFHEDFPFDFILEYKEERLGLLMWDKCFNSAGEATPIYRFNPHIKDFRGLF